MAYILLLLVFLLLPSPILSQTRTDIDLPVTKKVMILNFNPIIESQGGRRLVDIEGWNDPALLEQQYINEIKTISGNLINYQIISRQDVDDIPQKLDGFDYTDDSYLNCWNNRSTCHSPDIADYFKIITDFDLCGKRNRGEIDEVWMWGGPYFGYAEWTYAGPSQYNNFASYWIGTSCTKLFPIMGFNYETTYDNMVHDLSHRTEGLMSYAYGGWKYGYNTPPVTNQPDTNWDRFTVRAVHAGYTSLTPGCGNTHLPHNSLSTAGAGIDYGVATYVNNTCNDFLNYPNLTSAAESLNCSAWGCSQIGYFRWWFGHIPRYTGFAPDGKLNNWWRYVVDYEEATLAETAPIGWQDAPNTSICTLQGWACDPNKPFQPLNVNFYEGSTFIGSTLANTPNDPGVTQTCNGSTNNRFNFSLPVNLRNGQSHQITAYALGIDAGGTENSVNPSLSGNPRTINCSTNATPGPSPTSSPIPTPSPTYTIADLKNLILNYLMPQSPSDYVPDAKVNMLDAGYVIRWIGP